MKPLYLIIQDSVINLLNLNNFFFKKRNASTPLGIEPRTGQVDKVDMVEFGYYGK